MPIPILLSNIVSNPKLRNEPFPFTVNRTAHPSYLHCFLSKEKCLRIGKVVDENENPVAQVNISILGRQATYTTNDSGYFKITVPADKAFALVFSFAGKKPNKEIFCLMKMKKQLLQ
jgi:hypothetical protein